MLSLALAALLALPVPLQEEKPAPDEAVVAKTVETLESAFKKGEPAERVKAVEAAAGVPDARVVKAAAQGLKDKDRAVELATIQALGRLEHPDALEALEKQFKKKQKEILDDADLTVEYFREMARHGNPSSIALLSDKPFSSKSFEVVRARLYGLGNIRTAEAVEALVDMAQKVRMEDLKTWMPEVRVPLFHILGVDQGDAPQMWGRWLRENRKDLKIPEEPPEWKDSTQRERWNQFWGIREQRGEGGEGRGQG